jgi:hypothetical protein
MEAVFQAPQVAARQGRGRRTAAPAGCDAALARPDQGRGCAVNRALDATRSPVNHRSFKDSCSVANGGV